MKDPKDAAYARRQAESLGSEALRAKFDPFTDPDGAAAAAPLTTRNGGKRLKAVCVGTICFAFAIRLVGVCVFHRPPNFFHLTPCRVDSLAIGSYLAVIFADNDGKAKVFGSLYRNMALIAGGVSMISLTVLFFFVRGLWIANRFIS